MRKGTIELTEKQWNEDTYVRANGKRDVKNESALAIFGPSLCYGYGIYGTECFEKDGKYFVEYECGSTCD